MRVRGAQSVNRLSIILTRTQSISRKRSRPLVLPGLQGDVAVEEPVVLCTSRVRSTGGSLGCRRAVGGRWTDVAARRVVTPTQRAHGRAMVLTGRVRVGEGEWRRPQARVILVRALWGTRRDGEKGNERRSKVKLILYKPQASHDYLYTLSKNGFSRAQASSRISTSNTFWKGKSSAVQRLRVTPEAGREEFRVLNVKAWRWMSFGFVSRWKI